MGCFATEKEILQSGAFFFCFRINVDCCGSSGDKDMNFIQITGEVLVGKPEGRRPMGRPRRRWVDNIRMDLQEVGYGYMDWIGLAQDRDR